MLVVTLRLDTGMATDVTARLYIPGVRIDCSHLSAMDLNWRVVGYAVGFGWDGGSQSLDMLDADLEHYNSGTHPVGYDDPDEFALDYAEAMMYACDEAVSWLNDNWVAADCYLYIDDNCLYLGSNDEDV